MVFITEGDLFSLPVEAIVNPVNCVGVAGAGLALRFKQRYPDNYEWYRKQCYAGAMRPDNVVPFALTGHHLVNHRYIYNLATKQDWRDPSEGDYIEQGLKSLVKACYTYETYTVGMPALGCGLGGLQWKLVQALVEEAFGACSDVEDSIKVFLIPPVDQFYHSTKM